MGGTEKSIERKTLRLPIVRTYGAGQLTFTTKNCRKPQVA